MAHLQLWAAASAEPWSRLRRGAPAVLAASGSDKLRALSHWVEDELPVAIASRAPRRHVTQPELVKLVDWKLTRGKFRPNLLRFAQEAREDNVASASAKAFAQLLGERGAGADGKAAPAPAPAGKRRGAGAEGGAGPAAKRARAAAAAAAAAPCPTGTGAGADADADAGPAEPGGAAEQEQEEQQLQQQQQQQQPRPSLDAVAAALAALTTLKGVGPATASALLAAADASGAVPYMGDEALEASSGERSYTVGAYLELVAALRAKAEWLCGLEPEAGWTAQLVERCLAMAALEARGPPKAKAKGKAGGSTAGGARGARGGNKAAAAKPKP